MLKKLTICNYKIFKGENTIAFGTKEAPITTIIGRGGSGKTTLGETIFWCLYSNKWNSLLLKNSIVLNHEIINNLNEGEEACCSVELLFEIESVDYHIKREACFTKKDGNAIRTNEWCDIHNSKNEQISVSDFEKRFFPRELASFVFLNGDRDVLLRNKGWETLFRRALLKTLGVIDGSEGMENCWTDELVNQCIDDAKKYYNKLKYRDCVFLDYDKEEGFYFNVMVDGTKSFYSPSHTNVALADACIAISMANVIKKIRPEILSIWDNPWALTSEDQLSVKNIIDCIDGQALLLGSQLDEERLKHRKIGSRFIIQTETWTCAKVTEFPQ